MLKYIAGERTQGLFRTFEDFEFCPAIYFKIIGISVSINGS
jgi:hypothetical protein